MVLTKSELIGSLRHEVRVLLHLASKIDRTMLDYRPTTKQRSTLELLQYFSVMGPSLVQAAKAGGFDPGVDGRGSSGQGPRFRSDGRGNPGARRCVPSTARRRVGR